MEATARETEGEEETANEQSMKILLSEEEDIIFAWKGFVSDSPLVLSSSSSFTQRNSSCSGSLYKLVCHPLSPPLCVRLQQEERKSLFRAT